MQFRVDKKTGNKLSALGYGCMRFPKKLGHIDLEKAEKLVLAAVKRGVNYYDTAYIYPGSEAAMGEILAKNNLRDKVFIATKLPLIMCKQQTDFDKFFNIQLERLKTDYIDYYFMHMLTGPSQWEKLCDMGIKEWIKEKQEEGKIRQVGFSFHGKQEDFIALIDAYPWDFCQIQYNYINVNYQAGITGLQYAAAKGMPVIIMEPLLGGRLAAGLPEQANTIFKEANPEMSNAAWAMKWLWNHKEVTVVLSGMNRISQVRDNAKTAQTSRSGAMTAAELEAVEKVVDVFNKSYKIPCTGCEYCMPCPKEINIPGCFAAYNSSYAINYKTGIHQYLLSTSALAKEMGNAGKCVACGKCEQHCPQNIPIRDNLKDVARRMEPFWYRAGVSIFRKFQVK
jgi:predicted aldo/keto reductase-like oxidoreductase